MNAVIDISKVNIATKRLLLRPFCATDLMDFNQYAKVPGVGEKAGWRHHQSLEESQKILDMFIMGKTTFAVIFQNKVIGSIGIDKYQEDSFLELVSLSGVELGFVLAKDYWGQGLMLEACHAVINFLFSEQTVDFILCTHFSDNSQSARLQEKLGFKLYKTGVKREVLGETKELIINIFFK